MLVFETQCHPIPHLFKRKSTKDLAAGLFDNVELRDPAARGCAPWPLYMKDMINDREAQSNSGQTYHIFCVNTQSLWDKETDD